MEQQDPTITLLDPPVETADIKLGNWTPAAADDPAAAHLAKKHWEASQPVDNWEVARRSQAVFVYRETGTYWQAAAKYYTVKTGKNAEKYARRELACIERIRQVPFSTGGFRAIRPYSVWRGVLFLEYVDGLTLEDIIAVRRSRPGALIPALEMIASFLAELHSQQVADSKTQKPKDTTAEARKIVDNLSRYGVLKDNPIIIDGLVGQVGRWQEKSAFDNYSLSLNHGDATTTNFIFPDSGSELVVIDWERSQIADPAADLGRIMAEVEHSISQHGGNVGEADPLIERLMQVYAQTVSKRINAEAFFERARYYRAITSLRIARNGWLPRLVRTQLVAQALALLS